MSISLAEQDLILKDACVPWVLGQPFPESKPRLVVLIVPESRVVRLRLALPSRLLANPDALLFAVEDHLPTIEGRAVLLLSEQSIAGNEHNAMVQLLVYPKSLLNEAMSYAQQSFKDSHVIGAMTAAEWWAIALPPETAMWVDDGVESWVQLPSGDIYTVNLCRKNDPALWLNYCTEPMKGVVGYAADVPCMQEVLQGGMVKAHFEAVRWRVLPMTALYEAPRDHSQGWNLLTGEKWAALFFKKTGKHAYSSINWILGCLFCIGFSLVLYPRLYWTYQQYQQHSELISLWKENYPMQVPPKQIERAWIDKVDQMPVPVGKRLPHLDPLGSWSHINHLAVWADLPPLSELRFEGQRWWMGWNAIDPKKISTFKQLLTQSGWKVDVITAEGITRVVVGAALLE